MDTLLPITKIQKFCTHDGWGIRTVVFVKGCPLRCKWCHNPETQSVKNEIFYSDKFCIHCGACVQSCPAGVHRIEISGDTFTHIINREACIRCGKCADACPSGALEMCAKQLSNEAILAEVLKDKAFFGKHGGITVSGGEPMLYAENVKLLFAKAKEAGITTAMETCGFFESELLFDIVPVTDLFLFDVKDTNSERHRQNTGVPFEKILSNLQTIDKMGATTRLRCIMVNTVNMEQNHYEGIANIYSSLKNCEGVELIPYHTFGSDKALMIGRDSNANKSWIPDAKSLSDAKKFLKKYVKLINA